MMLHKHKRFWLHCSTWPAGLADKDIPVQEKHRLKSNGNPLRYNSVQVITGIKLLLITLILRQEKYEIKKKIKMTKH